MTLTRPRSPPFPRWQGWLAATDTNATRALSAESRERPPGRTLELAYLALGAERRELIQQRLDGVSDPHGWDASASTSALWPTWHASSISCCCVLIEARVSWVRHRLRAWPPGTADASSKNLIASCGLPRFR